MHKKTLGSGRFGGVNFVVGAALPLVFGCSLDVAPVFNDIPTPNIQITVLSGDNQTVTAGSNFPVPVQVRVLRDGAPFLGNVSYVFTPSAPPASFSFAQSNADGIASIQRNAGTELGPFTLRVYYLHCARPGFTDCFVPYQELGAVTVNGTVVAAP